VKLRTKLRCIGLEELVEGGQCRNRRHDLDQPRHSFETWNGRTWWAVNG
jgi:hypothetical protein